MRIVVKKLPRMDLEDFADRNGLTMEVREIHPGSFIANFKNAEVMENACLASVSGNGDTPDAAIESYASKISRTRLAINAYTTRRTEIDVPILSYHKSEE